MASQSEYTHVGGNSRHVPWSVPPIEGRKRLPGNVRASAATFVATLPPEALAQLMMCMRPNAKMAAPSNASAAALHEEATEALQAWQTFSAQFSVADMSRRGGLAMHAQCAKMFLRQYVNSEEEAHMFTRLYALTTAALASDWAQYATVGGSYAASSENLASVCRGHYFVRAFVQPLLAAQGIDLGSNCRATTLVHVLHERVRKDLGLPARKACFDADAMQQVAVCDALSTCFFQGLPQRHMRAALGN